MNKSLRVVFTSIILLAAFLSAALSFEACQTKTKTLEEKADDTFEQHSGEEFFEEDIVADDNYESDDIGANEYSNNENAGSVDYGEAADKTSNSSAETVTSYEETPIRRATAQGRYLIVAGNFLIENNADDMVSKLVRLGYNSAEVAVFDYSQYYTVVASRSDDYGLASSLAAEIKAKGVDCYVHTKK